MAAQHHPYGTPQVLYAYAGNECLFVRSHFLYGIPFHDSGTTDKTDSPLTLLAVSVLAHYTYKARTASFGFVKLSLSLFGYETEI